MRNVIFSLTAIIVVIFDQLSKLFITSNLSLGQAYWQGIFIRIILVHNSGAAFGIFQGNILPLIIIRTLGALLIIALFVLYGKRLRSWGGTWLIVALGLLLGGTVGNLIDSVRLGYVIDFIDLTYWPVFNIADSSVVISAIMLVIFIIRLKIKESKQA